MQSWIDDQIRVAEERWVQDLANKVSKLNSNPRDAWEATYTLAGIPSAHKSPKRMAFRKEDGTIITDDNGIMEMLEKHFSTVFNRRRPVKFERLDMIEQKEIEDYEDRDISFEEFEERRLTALQTTKVKVKTR